jgi:hypothetical protein
MSKKKNFALLHFVLQIRKKITLPNAQLQAVNHLKIDCMKINYSASGHSCIQGMNNLQPLIEKGVSICKF